MNSVVLQLGSREIAIPQSPLRTTFVRSHNRFELIRPNAECLVIKNHWGIRLFAKILCILGFPVLLFGLLGLVAIFLKPAESSPVGTGLLLLWGGVMFFMGIWLLGLRYRFDRGMGYLSMRFFLWSRRVPLTEIAAVQVIDAGRFQSGRADSGDGPKYVFSSYQMNLVLFDIKEPRLFVTYNSDLTDMVRKAQILSHFLCVPLSATGQIQTVAQSYKIQDVGQVGTESGAGRFRGNDTLRSIRDSGLPMPFSSWIDRSQPLPGRVKLLPRSIDFAYDLGMFVILGVMFFSMPALMIMMFWTVFEQGEWAAIIPLSIVSLLLASVPMLLLRRVMITTGAYFDQKRGRLRQGIFVGPEGVLVRMEPNRGYPIALERFVKARTNVDNEAGTSSAFVVETLDGTVEYFSHRMSFSPDQLNQCVKSMSKGGRG